MILKHGQLRGAIAPDQIVYLELLPFLLYLAILLVALNAILLDSPLRFGFLEYEDNLLPVLVYWPALLGLVLAATLATFYG